MPEYHVGCGLAEIYAGILKKNNTEWRTKSPVTEEAINAVRDYLFIRIKDGDSSFGYSWDLNSDLTIDLLVKITEKRKN